MKNYIYPAIFEKDADCIGVEFPDLPGCLTFGESFGEAVVMAKEALGGWIITRKNNGLAVPDPSKVAAEEGETVMLVEFDSAEYRCKHERKAVKR